MYRFALDDLFNWYKKERRKPLVLRGARQVGKSTLVRMFAAKHNLSLHEINLERNYYLDDVFKTLDMSKIMAEIEGLTGEIRDYDHSLLFLDEIQATPYAIQALRYFFEEYSALPLVAAGSLFEFTLADHNFSMPVGRIEYLHLGPMSFKEYLLERDEELYNYVGRIQLNGDIPHSYHKRLLHCQREFFFVGGIPEAVEIFTSTGSFESAFDIQRGIVDTYIDDFSKYAKKSELIRLQKVFRQLPRQIGKKAIYSNFSKEDRSGEVKNVIDLLSKAHLCRQVYHSDCSGIPLHAGINENIFKLLFIDCGLYNSMLGLRWKDIRTMDERSLVNEGSLAEQFIGQHLVFLAGRRQNPVLHYWLREERSSNAEVDFVINSGKTVIPVEVKAGKSGTLKSLHQFALQKKAGLTIRFDLNIPSVQRISTSVNVKNGSEPITFTLISLPLYLVEEVPRLVEEYSSSNSGEK